jgi:hypothetical protein
MSMNDSRMSPRRTPDDEEIVTDVRTIANQADMDSEPINDTSETGDKDKFNRRIRMHIVAFNNPVRTLGCHASKLACSSGLDA